MQVKNPTVIRPYENCIKLLLFSWPSLSNYIVTCRARMCHDWKMLSACAQVCVCVFSSTDGGTELVGCGLGEAIQSIRTSLHNLS